MFKILSTYICWKKIYKMQHLECSRAPFLYMGRTVCNPLNAELNHICHLLVLLENLTFMGPCIVSIFQYTCISNEMQRYTVYIWKLLYMFRVVLPPIIRNAYNCIYSIWYLSHRYCYLPLSWKSWNWFECAGSNSSTIAADSSNSVTNTRCCRCSCMRSWWWVKLPPETCRAVSRYK
jgi:hypothetical protein